MKLDDFHTKKFVNFCVKIDLRSSNFCVCILAFIKQLVQLC